MIQCIAIILIGMSLASACRGQDPVKSNPGAPPDPNATIKPQPPSPATPPDAPFPDRATVPEPTHGKVRRALKDAVPHCVDWMLHSCWSQPASREQTPEEANNPAFAHDMEIGNFNLKKKNYPGAELRFRSALEAVPNDPEANFKLAKSLDKQGRVAEAREEYTTFLSLFSASPFAPEARKALEELDRQSKRGR